MIEKKTGWCITMDGASHRGVRITDSNGNFLPYCSRYNDGENRFQNFLSLEFDRLHRETVWLFAPKSHESRFLSYFLSFSRRPRLIFLLLQHHELDNLFPILKKNCISHFVFENNNYLTRSVKNRTARHNYHFSGLMHVFTLERTGEN